MPPAGGGMEIYVKSDRYVRTTSIYVSVILCLLACTIIVASGILIGRPPIILEIASGEMVFILITLFDRRMTNRVHGFIFCTFVCNSVFMNGIYLENYFLEFTFFCGILILAALYNDSFLIMYQLILTLLVLPAHHFIFDVFNFKNLTDVLEYTIGCLLQTGIGLALYFNSLRNTYVNEKLAHAADMAKQAEKAKSDFLANMSHEIRTPMNAIIGLCELALREEGLPPNARDHCSQIQNSGRSLLSIINDILDFSKIEADKMNLVEDEFNITSTLNDVVNMAMARMGSKKLEFVVQVDTDIPKGLIGDELRIRQIMINIITNAIKYTNEGAVTLKVTHTRRDYGINLNVSVSDSGIGITRENLDKLFNTFQQVDTKKNRSVEGTGLGLVITKRLLSKMGGFINVTSTYGRGSEFRFVIPLRVANEEPFIKIREPEKIYAICLFDVDKFSNEITRTAYNKLLAHVSVSLPVRSHICLNFEDFKDYAERDEVTHCFTERGEYLKNQEYFNELSKKKTVILIQNRSDSVKVPASMKCIYKPFYELPLAGIYNNESVMGALSEKKMSTASFTASRARVLIVDDNFVNLQVAAGLMRPYSMQVLTADSGRQALEMLESKDFDLVFMDHMMPEMDGVEATQIIRSKPDDYYKNIPVIALTANAVNGAREMFLSNGFNGFLSKPIELSSLDRILKQNLPSDKIESFTSMNPKDSEEADSPEITADAWTAEYIDTALGISYTGNDTAAYLSILDTYVENGPEGLARIQSLFNTENWKDYVIEVHALKSSSLLIGARQLSEQAKALEAAGNASDLDYIKEHHGEAMELYFDVLDAGSLIMAENQSDENEDEAAVEPRNVEEAELRDILGRIRDALEDYDMDIMEEAAAEGLGAVFNGTDLSDEFTSVLNAAHNIDYTGAAKGTDRIAAICGLEV